MKRLLILLIPIMLVLVVASIIDQQQPAEAAELLPMIGVIPAPQQAPPPGQYVLQVTVEPTGSGSVLVEPLKPLYSSGEVVRLTAEPSTGFVFSHWSEDGWGIGIDNPMNYTVTASHKVTAYFVRQGQPLPSAPPEGVVPLPPQSSSPLPIYIVPIIFLVMLLGAVILTVVFSRRPSSAPRRQNLAKGMTWVARIISIGAIVFFFLTLSLSLIFRAIWASDILLLVYLGIALVGCIVSRWTQRVAGVILILVSLAMGSQLGLSSPWGIASLVAWSPQLGSPFLLAGMLLLLSWLLSRKTSSSVASSVLKP